MMKKIMVAAPVRNRAWILPYYINGLKRQAVPMDMFFVVNDSEDDSEEIIRSYGYSYVTHNLGEKVSGYRGHYSFENLAFYRNLILQKFLQSDCDYLFSVDTDIIIPPNSLQQLVEDDKDMISMLVKNHPKLDAYNILRKYHHIPPCQGCIMPVDITGAAVLIKRHVIEANVTYADHPMGEDVPFCEAAKRNGFGIYCDTRLKPIHVYKPNLILIA